MRDFFEGVVGRWGRFGQDGGGEGLGRTAAGQAGGGPLRSTKERRRQLRGSLRPQPKGGMGGIGGDAASPIFKFAFFKLLHFPRLWVQHPPPCPPSPPDAPGPPRALCRITGRGLFRLDPPQRRVMPGLRLVPEPQACQSAAPSCERSQLPRAVASGLRLMLHRHHRQHRFAQSFVDRIPSAVRVGLIVVAQARSRRAAALAFPSPAPMTPFHSVSMVSSAAGFGIFRVRLVLRLHRIGLAEPHQRRAHRVRPLADRTPVAAAGPAARRRYRPGRSSGRPRCICRDRPGSSPSGCA